MNQFNGIMYWLCLFCVGWNAWAFITTGSLIALAFALLCAFGLWGQKLVNWWERRK